MYIENGYPRVMNTGIFYTCMLTGWIRV